MLSFVKTLADFFFFKKGQPVVTLHTAVRTGTLYTPNAKTQNEGLGLSVVADNR